MNTEDNIREEIKIFIHSNNFDSFRSILEKHQGNATALKNVLLSQIIFGQNIFHCAISYLRNIEIFSVIFIALKKLNATNEEIKLALLQNDKHQSNIFHYIAISKNPELFTIVLDALIKFDASDEEIKSAFFQKDKSGANFFHYAVYSLELLTLSLSTLGTRAKSQEIENAFFEKDVDRINVLHCSAKSRDKGIFTIVLDVFTSCKTKQVALLEKNKFGLNILHYAAESKNTDIFAIALSALEKAGIEHEEIQDILLQKSSSNKTVLHYAAESENIELFNIALHALREKKAALLEKNSFDQNILHIAAKVGNLKLLYRVLDIFKESGIQPDNFFIKDNFSRNILHYAALSGKIDVFVAVLTIFKKFTDSQKIKTALLEKDILGENILYITASNSENLGLFTITLNMLYQNISGSQAEKDQEIASIFIFDKNKSGNSILDLLQKNHAEAFFLENILESNFFILDTNIAENFPVFQRKLIHHNNDVVYIAATYLDEQKVIKLTKAGNNTSYKSNARMVSSAYDISLSLQIMHELRDIMRDTKPEKIKQKLDSFFKAEENKKRITEVHQRINKEDYTQKCLIMDLLEGADKGAFPPETWITFTKTENRVNGQAGFVYPYLQSLNAEHTDLFSSLIQKFLDEDTSAIEPTLLGNYQEEISID